MKTCKDCGSYVSLGDGKNGKGETVEVGNCFRFPPTVGATGSAYPVVGAVERQCGEYTTKKATTKPTTTKRKIRK